MLIELLAQRLFGVSFPTFFIVVFKVAAALFMGLMTLLWCHVVSTIVEWRTHKRSVYLFAQALMIVKMLVSCSSDRLLLYIMDWRPRLIHNNKTISTISIVSIVLVCILFLLWWLFSDCRVKRFVWFSLCWRTLSLFSRRCNILIKLHLRQLMIFHIILIAIILLFFISFARIFIWLRWRIVSLWWVTATTFTLAALHFVTSSRECDTTRTLQRRGLIQEWHLKRLLMLMLSFLFTFFHQYFISKNLARAKGVWGFWGFGVLGSESKNNESLLISLVI